MVMGGKGLRSCEALDTIDNSIEYEAAVEKTKKQQTAVANALLAEQEASKLVTEAINLMPSLRDAESRAKVAHKRAVDTNAPDQQELTEKLGAAREARKQGQQELEDAKIAQAFCKEKHETAKMTEKRFAAEAEALRNPASRRSAPFPRPLPRCHCAAGRQRPGQSTRGPWRYHCCPHQAPLPRSPPILPLR